MVAAHENISQVKQSLLAEQAGAERITEQAALIDEARDAVITRDLDNRIYLLEQGRRTDLRLAPRTRTGKTVG